MDKKKQTFDKAELDLLKEGLSRSYKERFEMATRLYKIQQTMKKGFYSSQTIYSQIIVDIFDEDILNFWKALQDHHVDYIMIGGYATNLHGYQRFTGDMDIWLKDSRENRKRLREAFNSCNMGDYRMIETMQFVPGWTDFQLNNGLRLDVLIDMKGLENYTFDECLQLASIADIEGVAIPFLHINQLIANKKAVNRPKDQIDVQALEQIRQLRDADNQ